MANSPYSASATRGGSALDIGVATLAAAAVAFATYAMPADLFERLIEASGLPMLLSAAQPPLGLTARLAAIAASGMLTLAMVWLFLRALDRVPSRPRPEQREEELVEIAEVPRLRRFDAHPDAPARRPIFAGREFGEPAAIEAEDEVLEAVKPEGESLAADEPLVLEDPIMDLDPAEEPQPAMAEEPEAVPANPAPMPDDQSISTLMQRLEGGLQRKEKQQAIPLARMGEAPPEAARHRLRSAIDELQKMAGHG